MNDAPLRLHATGVAIGGAGVAIIGASGSGKSDLALRLIDRGAVLICDDAVEIRHDGSRLSLHSCATIAGKLEVRGIGIVDVPHVAAATLAIIVDLDADRHRYPDPWPVRDIAGVAVPELRLDPHEASAPIKVELALRTLLDRTG